MTGTGHLWYKYLYLIGIIKYDYSKIKIIILLFPDIMKYIIYSEKRSSSYLKPWSALYSQHNMPIVLRNKKNNIY